MLDISLVPKWLITLLTAKLYNACVIHEAEKKNEKNVFCLDCCVGICPHCVVVHHSSHRLLQIRRYVYHDVIRLGDADKLMDCSCVQSYTTNNSKVVFLNQRPQSRPPRVSGVLCLTCGRNLHQPFCFCSISCKLEHLLKTGCKLSKYIRNCSFLAMPKPGLDDGQMTPDSVLGPTGSTRTESGSSTTFAAELECQTLACTATIEVRRKKRSNLSGFRTGFRPACRQGSEISGALMMNRRKGTPQRAPLY